MDHSEALLVRETPRREAGFKMRKGSYERMVVRIGRVIRLQSEGPMQVKDYVM